MKFFEKDPNKNINTIFISLVSFRYEYNNTAHKKLS